MKLWKISVFKRSVDKILINVCLVVSFRYCVKVLTFWNFPKFPKHAISPPSPFLKKGGVPDWTRGSSQRSVLDRPRVEP